MTRVRYFDSARGFAIVLVILGHAVVVPEDRGFVAPEILLYFWEFFQPFRMPMLFFLSGCLLPRSLQKPWLTFIKGKLQFILWPYLIWICVRYLPDMPSLSIWSTEVWLAAGYLWFLFFLFFFYMIALAVRRIPYWITTAALFSSTFVLNGLPEKFVYHAAFFFLGAAVISVSPRLDFLRVVWVRTVVGFIALTMGVLSVFSRGDDTSNVKFPAVVACVFAIIALFQWLDGRVSDKFLRWVGQNSIVFYVSHLPIISAMTAVLHLVGFDLNWSVWLLTATVALLVGSVLTRLRHFLPISFLFELPSPVLRRNRPNRMIL